MFYPVKNFNSQMRGAPGVNGTPGSFIAWMKAVLIDGFGDATAITGTISNGICRLELNATDVFQQDKVILISGANVTSINGEQWVTKVTDNSLEFKTLEGDQTLIGTITVKYAPVGNWYMPFTGTNTAVFRTSDPMAGDICFRVDDTQARSASMRMYGRMGDVNNGELQYPTQLESPFYFTKSFYANTNAYPWIVVADTKTVYISKAYWIYSLAQSSYFYTQRSFITAFGYYNSEGYSSKTNAFIAAPRDIQIETYNYLSNSAPPILSYTNAYVNEFRLYLNKATNSYNQNALGCPRLSVPYTQFSSGRILNIVNLPNRKTYLSDVIIYSNNYLIGSFPGVYAILNNVQDLAAGHNIIIDGIDELNGRKLLKIYTQFANSSYSFLNYDMNLAQNTPGIGLFDITGPW